MLRPRSLSIHTHQAFSLVEVLVVISILGILASLAIPNITDFRNRSNYAKNERNAQTVAELLSTARTAGATNKWQSVEEALDDLEDGIVVKVGSEEIRFDVQFSPEERSGLTPYLAVDTTRAMVYYTGSSQ